MANVTVRKGNGHRAGPLVTRNPFRAMRNLLRWDPFREMREMAPLPAHAPSAFSPAFDVTETNDAYVFKADLPGVKESDVEVTVTRDRLTVTGKREAEREEATDRYYTYERSYGGFTRSFTLPAGADINPNAVTAHLKEGVLTVTLKKEPSMVSKKIAVKSGSGKP